MNKFVFYIFFFTIGFNLKAQGNLVPNGSFEEYYSCPISNDLGNDQLELAKGWWKPTLGTSDYFNRCNTDIVGVPNNFWGYQEAFQGDGYTGIGAIGWYLSTGKYLGGEYIQTELLSPLGQCEKYYFEMYINFSNYSTYAFSKIGVVFTKDKLQFDNQSSIVVKAQIINNSGFLSDTIDWVKISGSYTASGGEKYLTIGYFFDSVENDTLNFQPPMFFNDEGYGYYYIDMVSLIEKGVDYDCEYIVPNVFTPNGDGNNDAWIYFANDESELKIFNRWGQTVYHNIGSSHSWSGNNCFDGVYFYKLSFGKELKTGFIQLIR